MLCDSIHNSYIKNYFLPKKFHNYHILIYDFMKKKTIFLIISHTYLHMNTKE